MKKQVSYLLLSIQLCSGLHLTASEGKTEIKTPEQAKARGAQDITPKKVETAEETRVRKEYERLQKLLTEPDVSQPGRKDIAVPVPAGTAESTVQFKLGEGTTQVTFPTEPQAQPITPRISHEPPVISTSRVPTITPEEETKRDQLIALKDNALSASPKDVIGNVQRAMDTYSELITIVDPKVAQGAVDWKDLSLLGQQVYVDMASFVREINTKYHTLDLSEIPEIDSLLKELQSLDNPKIVNTWEDTKKFRFYRTLRDLTYPERISEKYDVLVNEIIKKVGPKVKELIMDNAKLTNKQFIAVTRDYLDMLDDTLDQAAKDLETSSPSMRQKMQSTYNSYVAQNAIGKALFGKINEAVKVIAKFGGKALDSVSSRFQNKIKEKADEVTQATTEQSKKRLTQELNTLTDQQALLADTAFIQSRAVENLSAPESVQVSQQINASISQVLGREQPKETAVEVSTQEVLESTVEASQGISGAFKTLLEASRKMAKSQEQKAKIDRMASELSTNLERTISLAQSVGQSDIVKESNAMLTGLKSVQEEYKLIPQTDIDKIAQEQVKKNMPQRAIDQVVNKLYGVGTDMQKQVKQVIQMWNKTSLDNKMGLIGVGLIYSAIVGGLVVLALQETNNM